MDGFDNAPHQLVDDLGIRVHHWPPRTGSRMEGITERIEIFNPFLHLRLSAALPKGQSCVAQCKG
jgi:hypothetical protein